MRTAIAIRPYRAADREVLEGFFNEFQQELVAMDDLGRIWCPPGFGKDAAEQCLREVHAERGLVLIAELDGGAGWVRRGYRLHAYASG